MSGLGTYLDCLFGAEPAGAFCELRWRLRDGRMGREFFAVRGPRLSALIEARGRTTDLYVGVAPRSRQEGTRAAVERSHVLYVDCDEPPSIEALERYRPAPSMIVRSGSGAHGYWSLVEPVAPDELEQANRRLAHALGADMRATDAARILRPPGTFNHKTGSPVAVTLEATLAIYANAAAVVGGLPDAPEGRPAPARSLPARGLAGGGDHLLAIPSSLYVPALTGREPNAAGYVQCPFHSGGEERTPSLKTWDDPDRGWACFGACALAGGTIVDFGARLFGIRPRGAGYHQIRQRLERELQARAAA